MPQPDAGEGVAIAIRAGSKGLALIRTISRHVGEGIIRGAVGINTAIAHVQAVPSRTREVVNIVCARRGRAGNEGKGGRVSRQEQAEEDGGKKWL